MLYFGYVFELIRTSSGWWAPGPGFFVLSPGTNRRANIEYFGDWNLYWFCSITKYLKFLLRQVSGIKLFVLPCRSRSSSQILVKRSNSSSRCHTVSIWCLSRRDLGPNQWRKLIWISSWICIASSILGTASHRVFWRIFLPWKYSLEFRKIA